MMLCLTRTHHVVNVGTNNCSNPEWTAFSKLERVQTKICGGVCLACVPAEMTQPKTGRAFGGGYDVSAE